MKQHRMFLIAGLLAATAPAVAQHIVDLDAATPFSEGIRGQSLTLNQPPNNRQYIQGLLQDGAMARSPGAYSQYDWKTGRDGLNEVLGHYPSLYYQRDAATYGYDPIFGVNASQLGTGFSSGNPTLTKDIQTLADLAADWVYYSNHMAQSYAFGETIPDSDPRAQRILSEINWGPFPKLSYFGSVPEVTYWHVDNEPGIPFRDPGLYPDPGNGYPGTMSGADYANRYKQITDAMKATAAGIDSTIKVGPTLAAGNIDVYLPEVLSTGADLDFVSYHPYGYMHTASDPAWVTAHLNDVKTFQMGYVNQIRGHITAAGRDPDAVELIPTEFNPSHWISSHLNGNQYAWMDARQAHALALTENIFTYAEAGMRAAMYWEPPRPERSMLPFARVQQMMVEHLNDQLVDVHESQSFRVYTTRDSETGDVAIWGLNFSETDAKQLEMALAGITEVDSAMLYILEDQEDGITSLNDFNVFNPLTDTDVTRMGGVPIDWTVIDLTAGFDPGAFTLQVDAAELAVLVLSNPVPEPASLALLGLGGLAMLRRRGA